MILMNEDITKQYEKYCEISQQLIKDGVIKEHNSIEYWMSWLASYANHEMADNTHCVIYSDFAPLSFTFTIFLKMKEGHGMSKEDYPARLYPELVGYKAWFNGGIIFHGNHDNGGDGGAPTFSVNLTPISGWSVHT